MAATGGFSGEIAKRAKNVKANKKAWKVFSAFMETEPDFSIFDSESTPYIKKMWTDKENGGQDLKGPLGAPSLINTDSPTPRSLKTPCRHILETEKSRNMLYTFDLKYSSTQILRINLLSK